MITTIGPPDLAHELARLTAAVEAIEKRLGIVSALIPLEPTPTPVPAKSDEGVLSPVAIFLGFVGILIGWGLGSSYARRQERSRRSRLRF